MGKTSSNVFAQVVLDEYSIKLNFQAWERVRAYISEFR